MLVVMVLVVEWRRFGGGLISSKKFGGLVATGALSHEIARLVSLRPTSRRPGKREVQST